MIRLKIQNKNRGFSFVELIVGTAVFLVMVVAVYNAYTSIFDVVHVSRAKIEAVNLANEQLEIVRNLPYADVGVINGIPRGVLLHNQTIVRDAYVYDVTTTVRNIDDPFDGILGGTPNDLSPADSKLVEVEIACPLCRSFVPIIVTTRVSPKNLETASTNGALFIRVFDANGNAVSDASVHIENTSLLPNIIIDDVTNATGMLQIVDAPPSVNGYQITVTKPGYSTDRTYAATVSNPNPTNPHATVVLQQVTQVSFVIDRLSTFNISSVTDTCAVVPNIDFNLKGNKLIGAPNVVKYDQDHTTNGSGLLSLNNIEWDTYNFLATDATYDLVGMNPLLPVSIAPNGTTDVQMIMALKDPRTVWITVKDDVTDLPVSDAVVELISGGISITKLTGKGYISQTDWSGGAGQATTTDKTMYFSSDGNIETSDPVGDLKLKNIFSTYSLNGWLESSAFDVGSMLNFQQIDWLPQDQPVAAGNPNLRIQIATNNDGGDWNYTGPDGTSSTYYTVSNKNIHSSNNAKRFIRYKILLDTADDAVTPNLSEVFFTFTSSCTPPGQVSFSGLDSGNYTLNISKAGYVTQVIPVNVNSPWQAVEVILVPN